MFFVPLAQAIRDQSNKGRTALVWGGIITVLGLSGFGLLTTGLMMAMTIIMGPIFAALVLGAGLVGLAALCLAARVETTAPPPKTAVPPLAELGFTLGFMASRAFLRQKEPIAKTDDTPHR